MAKSQILWTILPYGMIESDNQQYQRVSVVASPRLTPEGTNEGKLGSFDDFINWPETVLKKMKFAAEIAGVQFDLKMLSEPDPEIWRRLFTQETPVAGFKFMDMSKVNLLSYPVRNILAYIRDIYGRMAEEHPLDYPSLLPWGDGILKDMLTEAGTREKVEDKRPVTFEPGFDRFFGKGFRQPLFSKQMDVPAPDAGETSLPEMVNMPLNIMEPDFRDQEKDLFRTQLEYDLYQADRFYRRSRPTDEELQQRRPNFPVRPPQTDENEFDFHRIIASLASYPELMRRLGLILDFVLVPSREMPDIATLGKIRMKINWNRELSYPHTDETPWTAFMNDAGQKRFITRPRSADYKNGFLNMRDAGDSYANPNALYDVYQVDPDGAALKTVNYVLTGQNLTSKDVRKDSNNRDSSEVTYTTGNKQGYAALRSGGLGVSQHRRVQRVAVDAAATRLKNRIIQHEIEGGVTLFTEDVLRGYRVDVATVPDETALDRKAWRSLCAREGAYELWHTATNGVAVEDSGIRIDINPRDEGYVSGPSTTSGGAESSNPDDHYLHESLFRWTGWSLCTPRPGRAIMAEEATDGSQLQREAPGNIEEEDVAVNGSGVKTNFVTAKGTLPRLRFGRLYRIRARVVDLAGNSLALDDDTNSEYEGASNAVGYLRFEPIDPPVVVQRRRVSEGESLERMVLRSNFNVDPKGYVNSEVLWKAVKSDTQPFDPNVVHEYITSENNDFDYCITNERHFVPPKSSQSQCETHGLFDPYMSGDWQSVKKSYAIAARDEQTLYDKLEGSDIEVITPSDLAGIATTTAGVPKLPDGNNPTGDRMAGGQYIIHREEQITTPWLPDGAAEGIAIRAVQGHKLPGVTEAKMLGGYNSSCQIAKIPFSSEFVITVRHGGTWPDQCGFRLVLAEINHGTTVFADDDEPFWDEEKRTLTFFMPKGWIVRLLYSSFAKKDYIHHFGIPQWVPYGTRREPVLQYAFFGTHWMITPFRELTLVHATQQPVWNPEFDTLNLNREIGSHEVTLVEKKGITMHSPSTSKFEIEAAWTEWVDDLSKDEPELRSFNGRLGEIRLAENYKNDFILKDAIDAQWSDLISANPDRKQRPDVHALGDTRFRLIKYRIRATTRFREYLPPSINENQDLVTRLGPVAIGASMILPPNNPKNPDPGVPILEGSGTGSNNRQSLVPASAPPADPKVLYVVPTMRWGEKQKITGGYNVTRSGNGLRVWLDRPWFSSGDGELLGVVIYKNGGTFSVIPKDFVQLVTQWGADPFWESVMSKPNANVSDFPRCVKSEEVKLQETSDFSNDKVTIVGHRVHFDYEKKLWYCDIEINLPNYMPFVRLALVRYQPNALDTVKISKVVLTDFAQVLPNRSVSVTTNAKKDITVTLNGMAPSSGPMSNDNPYMPELIKLPDGTTVKNSPGNNKVEVAIQTRDPAIDSDLAWTDDFIIKISPNISVGNGQFSWSTLIPSSRTPKTGIHRLMLREFEQFYSDDVAPSQDPGISKGKRVVEERLVFSYIIPI